MKQIEKLEQKWFFELAKNLLHANVTTKEYSYEGQPVYQSFHIYFAKHRMPELIEIEGYIPVKWYPNAKLKRGKELGTIGNFRVFIDDKLKADEIRIVGRI